MKPIPLIHDFFAVEIPDDATFVRIAINHTGRVLFWSTKGQAMTIDNIHFKIIPYQQMKTIIYHRDGNSIRLRCVALVYVLIITQL